MAGDDLPHHALDTGSHDYSTDGRAALHRQLKVAALRRWCWDHRVRAAEVALWLLEDPALLRRISRDAGVNPPAAGSPTWPTVAADLSTKEAWAAAYPTHPSAWRKFPRPSYLPEETEPHALPGSAAARRHPHP